MKQIAITALLLVTACSEATVSRNSHSPVQPGPTAMHSDRDDPPRSVASAKPGLPQGRPDTIKDGVTKWDNGDGTHGVAACCMPPQP